MGDEDKTTEQGLIESFIEEGWEYIDSKDLNREYSDVLNEKDVFDSLVRLNESIAKNPQYADDVIGKLRAIITGSAGEGLIAANERFMSWMHNNESMPFGRDFKHVTVKLIDYDNPENNRFVVSHQVMYPYSSSEGGKRFDIVLYINGLPISVGECKTPTRPSISWVDGALDIEEYEMSDASPFLAPNVLNFASEGKEFMYGGLGAPSELWGPWNYNGLTANGLISGVRKSASSLFNKRMILDIIKNYMLFANDNNHKRIKIVPRYQQVEGANEIVERVRAGHPKKGLIWHFQGSGKSLLMVFASQKLRRDPELNNPTIIVVVDRVELDSQISGTFAVSNIPNTMNIGSIKELSDALEKDVRKILITTIHKFGNIPADLNTRGNIVVMVDEAHRTQYGNLGMQMRAALPNAFFFGLTGTPISKESKNTFEVFGSEEDEGGYLSKYSFGNSVRDRATLPLYFETVNVRLHVDQDAINEEFELMTEDLDYEEKEALKKKASNIKNLIIALDRVAEVCAHIARHFKEKVEPNGFKAMVVTYDRECCVLYYNELLKYFPRENLQIVMHTGSKGDQFKEFHLTSDDEKNVKENYNNPKHSLKILIVTSRLITGFDAKILQTMYLDKPLKEHTLLQAICRTNRVYVPQKTHGTIVDYLGLFSRVGQAFDYGDGKPAISNLDELKSKIPELMNKCLGYFDGIDMSEMNYTTLEQAQDRVFDVEIRDRFAEDYLKLHKAWESISPDPVLKDYLITYKWLSSVYNSLRPVSSLGKMVWQSLGKKTLEIIHRNVDLDNSMNLESFILNEETLEVIIQENGVAKTARQIEVQLIARMRKHEKSPEMINLGKKLDEIRAKHEQNQIDSVVFIKDLLELAKDVLEVEQKIESMDEQSRAKAALTELFEEVRNENTPVMVEDLVKDIDEKVKEIRFKGWEDTIEGRRTVKKDLRRIIRIQYKIMDEDVFNKAYNYVQMYYKVEDD